MSEEIKINRYNKSLTFINNGIAYSQFGVADEILDLIEHLQQRVEQLEKEKDKLIEDYTYEYNLRHEFSRKYDLSETIIKEAIALLNILNKGSE